MTERFDSSKLDWKSYNLGVIMGFAECVGAGVKKLGLSASMSSDEYDMIIDDVKLIAKDNSVLLYTDEDFLETVLFPAAYTRGKTVIHIYQNQSTNDEYLELHDKKRMHEAAGTLTDEIQRELAWSLGKLLSYSNEAIKRRLK